jgi:uncharacterized membrane protein
MTTARISFGATILIAIMFGASLYTLALLPHGAQVPIHFGFDGTPNGWAPAPIGLLLMPAMAAGLSVLFALLPRIDPRGGNLLRSEKAVGTIWLAVVLLCAAAHYLVVAGALHVPFTGGKLIMVLIGGFFVVIGNVFGKLRANYMVGIRTPLDASRRARVGPDAPLRRPGIRGRRPGDDSALPGGARRAAWRGGLYGHYHVHDHTAHRPVLPALA